LNTELYLDSRQFSIVKLIVETNGIEINDLASKLGVKPESLMRDLTSLESHGLIRVDKLEKTRLVLTSEALEALEKGLVEERIHRVMYRCIDRSVNEFIDCVSRESGLSSNMVKIGLQYLIKGKCIVIDKKIVKLYDDSRCLDVLEEAAWIKSFLRRLDEALSQDIMVLLKRRKLIEEEKEQVIVVYPEEKLREAFHRGLVKEKKVITVVKPSLANELDKYVIKTFDPNQPTPRVRSGRTSAYIDFLDEIREILVYMGFEEVKGKHVEVEFWNFDVLFQAQDHPARDIHDTFYVKNKIRERIPKDLLERAKSIHEKYWGYVWDEKQAFKPILRTQTTAVTIRALYERGAGDYRVFTIDRVFRPEDLDPKHSMEFHQVDGIIVGKNVSFKHLLAFFKEFSSALGIREIWFKPAYFPFTEPSVEGFVKHPRLGWMEVFPGGMFRPEVLEIVGVKGVNVAAWCFGVDRLAMAVLDIDDIRDLFTRDLNYILSMKNVLLPFFTRRTSAGEVRVVKTIHMGKS